MDLCRGCGLGPLSSFSDEWLDFRGSCSGYKCRKKAPYYICERCLRPISKLGVGLYYACSLDHIDHPYLLCLDTLVVAGKGDSLLEAMEVLCHLGIVVSDAE
jgi:hypothetical protein